MADITMCMNSQCPSHGACYRFNAPVNPHWQAYAKFIPAPGELACAEFIENDKRDALREE